MVFDKDMREIKLTLPYPPTLNNMFITKGRIRVLSPKARAYKAEVVKRAQIARIEPIEGNVRVTMGIYRPRKIGDIDNLSKAIFDSLKGSAWHDDKQVVELHLFRYDDKDNPRVELHISEAS